MAPAFTTNGVYHETDVAIDSLYAWWPPQRPPAPPLPEAPASVNCHLMLEGRQVQVTLRDTDETRLLGRLATLLRQYPVTEASIPAQRHNDSHAGWCKKHNVQMQQNSKAGRVWWSHRTADGRWCKGR